MTVLRREQGRFEDIEPFARAMIGFVSWNPAWRCVLTLMLADVGRHDEARRELDMLAQDDFTCLPPDMNFLSALTNLSEACALLRDAPRAAVLQERFAPHASRNIVIGGPSLCTGPVTRFLGMLLATLGRHEEAFACFDDAIVRCAALGARPWMAHTQHQYALALAERGAPGDRDRAQELVAASRATARRLGMHMLIERLAGLPEAI